MKKFIFVMLILMLLLPFSVFATPTYITITYKVSSPTGSPPATLYATAQIVYDSSQNPIHTTFPVPASWNATTGSAIWSLPAGCYVKFVCQATGLNGIYKIPSSNAYLNDLVPVQPPPEPSWTANYVPYTGATGDVNLGGYNLEANSLFISGNSIWGKIHDGAGPIFVLSNYGGTLVSGNFLELNIDRSKVLFVDMYGGVHLQPVRGEVPLQIQSSGEIITFRSEVSEDTNTLSFECPLDKSVTTTVPSTGGIIWTNNNLGYANYETDGILTSTDWNTFSKKEDALTKGDLSESTSSVLTITNGTGAVIGEGTTIQVKQASALQDGYLSKEDFATFNGKDGVVGNEVTDTADTSLTRTGTGASDDPYKLKLNLANSNTFTANQTAPYFITTGETNPDLPRPYGFPFTSANALDDEFNDGNFSGWTATWLTGSPSITEANGLVKISNAHSGYIYKAVDDGDYRITLKGSLAYDTKIGVAVLKSDGTGYAVCLVTDGAAYRKVISYKITKASNNWDTLTAVTTINYHDATYLGLRYWNDGGTRKISWGTSANGLNFETFGYSVTSDVPSTVSYIAIYSYCGGASGDFMRGARTMVDWFRVD